MKIIIQRAQIAATVIQTEHYDSHNFSVYERISIS